MTLKTKNRASGPAFQSVNDSLRKRFDLGKEPHFNGTARDLTKLEEAINIASGRAAVLWVTITTLWFVLVSAAISMTDQRLALMLPIRLPALGIDVRFDSAIVTFPALFLLLHAYGLLKLVLLRNALDHYDAKLADARVKKEAKATYWQRLDIFVFTRLFGPGYDANSFFMMLPAMRLFVSVGLYVLPLGTLALYLYTFVRIQDRFVTTAHTVCLIIDFLVVVVASGLIQSPPDARQSLRPYLNGSSIVASVLFLAALLATDWTGKRGLSLAGKELLVGLPSEHRGKSLNLADRNLRNAKLNRVDLNNANLDGSDLTGADLSGALLAGASLREAILTNATLTAADLTGAVLNGARLDHANLTEVKAAGAAFNRADLQHADLKEAIFPGATLLFVRLGHSKLIRTDFKGAILDYSDLQHAEMEQADFEAASCQYCDFANVQPHSSKRPLFLSLDAADFIGTNLDRQLQDTSPDRYSQACSRSSRTVVLRDPDPDCPLNIQKDSMRECVRWINELDAGTLRQDVLRHRELERPLYSDSQPNCSEIEEHILEAVKLTACRADHAPHVARAMLSRLGRSILFEEPPWNGDELATALKNDQTCPGAKGLSTTERHKLWTLSK